MGAGNAHSHIQLDDLVAMRYRFTAESKHTATNCLRNLAKSPNPAALRAGLIPEAHSPHQRVLETSLLLTMRYCDADRVYRAVSPRTAGLVVDLENEVVDDFFRSLLTWTRSDGDHPGVPGLRVVPRVNTIQLRLLDEDSHLTDARVEVNGIPGSAWEAIWRSTREPGKVDPLLANSPVLSPGERKPPPSAPPSSSPAPPSSSAPRAPPLPRSPLWPQSSPPNGGCDNCERFGLPLHR
ncbi:hypothetical protein [Actinokineospora auranticolor]|nr:hypothetical protein [Actinokineospora auranticolor]